MSENQQIADRRADFVIQPLPHWIVKHDATDDNWNSDIMSYSFLNVKIYQQSLGTFPIANISNNEDLDTKYRMSVKVPMLIWKVCFSWNTGV